MKLVRPTTGSNGCPGTGCWPKCRCGRRTSAASPMTSRRVEAFTDIFHIDVADGHFSPALLFFPDLVAAARRATAKPLHVHLMVADLVLASQVEQFADAGADLISVHAENANADAALEKIAARGLKAGIVLQLHSPVAAARPFLDRISMLTLLGTRIGIKGQDLDPEAEARLREARALLAAKRRIASCLRPTAASASTPCPGCAGRR